MPATGSLSPRATRRATVPAPRFAARRGRTIPPMIAVMIALLHPLSSAAGAHAQASLDGAWRMTIAFDNGGVTAGLEVVTKGDRVSGRFVAEFAGGEIPIEGEIRDGTLTFNATTSGGPHPGLQLTFSGAPADDGRLAGVVSASFGEFAWNAERLARLR